MIEIKQDALQQELEANKLVVLDFYSTECPPCEALAPKYEALGKLYGKDVRFIKMFRQENRELAEKFGIRSSPSVLFFKDGQQVGEVLTGGIRRSDIMRNLDALLPGSRVKAIHASVKPKVTDAETIVLGGGPAGLAAAIYLAQAKVNTVVVDPLLPGGQVSTTHQVSNYPGFIEPQPGFMLAHNMADQAKAAGATLKVAVEVNSVDLVKKEVLIDNHETLRAKKILITTGASPRYLNVEGEKEFYGKGISYCATCDAKYYHDKEVVIIGGGNTAVEESEFISKFASRITMVQQFPYLTANRAAQERALADPKINILFSHEPRGFYRKNEKMVVKVENLDSGETNELFTDGVFVFVGMKPNLEMINEPLDKDQWGYLKVDADMRTSMPGVFAAGDVISKQVRQITTAVGDGTIASITIAKELR